ncbi:MAG: type II secretion system F family protein [Thermocladium sp.]
MRDPFISIIERNHARTGYAYDKRGLSVFVSVMELAAMIGAVSIFIGIALGEGLISFTGEALLLVSLLALGFSSFYPIYLVSVRRSHFDNRFVYTLLQLSPLLSAGTSISDAIKHAYDNEEDPVIKRELGLILKDMSNGIDPVTALRRSVERVPSHAYRDPMNILIEGSMLTSKIGELILEKSNSMLTDKLTRLNRAASDLGILFEVYTLAVMLFPLLLTVLSMSFSILGNIAIGPVPINTAGLLFLLTVFYVPLASLVFYIIFSMYESTL